MSLQIDCLLVKIGSYSDVLRILPGSLLFTQAV